jgi:hypothetical protein
MEAEAGMRTLAHNRVEAADPEQTSRVDRAPGAVRGRPERLASFEGVADITFVDWH